MRKFCALTTGLVLVLAAVDPATAADKVDVRAVIDRAIKAVGGADKLAKFKGETFKAKGKFYGLGDGVDFTGEWAVQLPKQLRVQIEGDVNGMKFTFTRVSNGNKLWERKMDNTEEITDKDQLKEDMEARHANWVASLLPLRGKDFRLAPMGEIKIAGGPAIGVTVSHKGYRDVHLFFGKKSGLLVMSQTMVKDLMGGGDEELKQETVYGNYKEVNGLKRPWKVTINRDGKRFIETEVTEMTMQESLDDAVFAKP
jgi:hypothetical protein